jgi:hypothetical protein
MPVMSPITIDSKDEANVIQTLHDELDSFFYGHELNLSLKFSGIDMVQFGKLQILHLNPVLSHDVEHCVESMEDICRSYIRDKDQRYKNGNNKLFVPLARSHESFGLEKAVAAAREEFDFPIELPIDSISLFKKREGHWYERAILHTFKDGNNSFLQLGAS